MTVLRFSTVTPSAARLTGSLRDIGYDFWSAVADLVDNSIAADATRIDIDVVFDGAQSRVVITDDGAGMTAAGVSEALRFGSHRSYGRRDLGRYGLGLKTASLSQCRSLTVASRRASSQRICVRRLDLDVIEDWDEWVVIEPPSSGTVGQAREILREAPGTVITWENLDRVLPKSRPDGGWARRRLDSLTAHTAQHLSMVFHRFLEPGIGARDVSIAINGEKLRAWDPFATAEPATKTLAAHSFELSDGVVSGTVRLDRYVLPSREGFGSLADFERMSGPMKWNRQQGLYVYRADRLVQWGGWAGLRAIDEHTKLARAALSFTTDLDDLFNINVAKMRVTVPPQLRTMLERPIQEMCGVASDAYRRPPTNPRGPTPPVPNERKTLAFSTSGVALRSAALQTGDYDALKRIAAILEDQAPEVVDVLGLRGL